MKPFLTRILVCLIPIVVSAYIVGIAWKHYEYGQPGLNFRLGVDLVGGTILVYEVDVDRFENQKLPDNYSAAGLAASLKKRIDPNDLYNVTIRPVSQTRIEIILPTGGAHQARLAEAKWKELIEDALKEWPALREVKTFAVPEQFQGTFLAEAVPPVELKPPSLDVSRGQTIDLAMKMEEAAALEKKADPAVNVPTRNEIDDWIKKNYLTSKERRDLTGEEVQKIKDLIRQVGSLEFRILANDQDDKAAIASARAYIAGNRFNGEPASDEEKARVKEKLLTLAERGQPPPAPTTEGDSTEFTTAKGDVSYQWIELGREERRSLDLDNAAETDPKRSARWQQAAEARKKGEAIVIQPGEVLLYSRDCVSRRLDPAEREHKKYEYFLLTRMPKPGQAVTGDFLVNARSDVDKNLQPCVLFKFNARGGDLFYEVTSNNRPSGEGNRFHRMLAIILDNQIVSAPRLNEAIRSEGQITGNFTKKQVDQLVSILNSGALPATLKPQPVSENTMGATLGDDTIKAGTFSVGLAFAAVLLFMLVYYRFAGLVACIALLANLLMTIAFMVLVHATFTLPGLAGLVLTLGMAVDANVLIYERLREERDRGASLPLAIRNGYDRAFPTIIDTHLTSIFTAIVLYVVGNDQLKGFGVSLTVGLIISLFTSLYMTRLMFDFWQTKGWLHKLSMLRFLTKPSIDFMRIRYYWFTATIILTIFGITVFLIRGNNGLNIDFVGGTAYTGRLEKPMNISQIRDLLSDKRQGELLKVKNVEATDDSGMKFRITYESGAPVNVVFPSRIEGTAEQQREEVAHRASTLPDLSVEQIFTSSATESGSDASTLFNVRTSEKASDLVQVEVVRLLTKNEDGKDVSLLARVNLDKTTFQGKKAFLTFNGYASPSYVKSLLEREFLAKGFNDKAQAFDLAGLDKAEEGRYKLMEIALTKDGEDFLAPPDLRTRPDFTGSEEEKKKALSDWEARKEKAVKEKFEATLNQFKADFELRPPTERLENFDRALAEKIQGQAMWAIVLSWGAILLYLWFRFGNWTFGLATVACLIHDLFFTLGMIAFSHYIHMWMPGVATFLGLQDFKIDLPCIAALLTLIGYSVSDTIVVFDRIREVRGKNPELTPQMINDSVNQTLSRTLLTAFSVWLVVIVLYIWGGEGVHLFAFVMVVGVIVGTYSSIYIASPLLLIFGEGKPTALRDRKPTPEPERVTS